MSIIDKVLGPYYLIYDTRQRLMKIPTDPKEIHRRADIIRARLRAERRLGKLEAIERVQLHKDLSLIKFDQAVRN